MLKETTNGYILVEILKSEKEKEKLLQRPFEAYQAKVLKDSSNRFKEQSIVYITKAGLMTVSELELKYIIHQDRVLGIVEGAE